MLSDCQSSRNCHSERMKLAIYKHHFSLSRLRRLHRLLTICSSALSFTRLSSSQLLNLATVFPISRRGCRPVWRSRIGARQCMRGMLQR